MSKLDHLTAVHDEIEDVSLTAEGLQEELENLADFDDAAKKFTARLRGEIREMSRDVSALIGGLRDMMDDFSDAIEEAEEKED